ncbi:MAG: FmdB family zinc ribbon protein [Solirubrobacterales bacterium]
MPLYEYACRSCGHRFEELVGPHVGTAPSDVRCPACGADRPERLLSGYATTRGLTPNQKRRLEDARGVDRDGARKRFGARRDAARRGRGPGRGRGRG